MGYVYLPLKPQKTASELSVFKGLMIESLALSSLPGGPREFANLEFPVSGGMGIIKSPLFKRDVFADKMDQPAVLLVKRLNEGEQIGNTIHRQ